MSTRIAMTVASTTLTVNPKSASRRAVRRIAPIAERLSRSNFSCS